MRRTLRQRWPEVVASVVHYGAVDLDRRHLVVWVLLTGPAEDRPAWYFPAAPAQVDAAAAGPLHREIAEVLAVVRSTFAAGGWPDAGALRVGFDAEERVRQGGGWSYFR